MMKRLSLFVLAGLVVAFTASARAESTTGTWSVRTGNGTQLTLKNMSANSMNEHSGTVDAGALGIADALRSTGTHVSFRIHHEAGDYVCDGWVRDGRGAGTYVFNANEAYFSALAQRGYHVDDLSAKLTFADMDITTEYIDSINAAGFHPDQDDLISFRSMNIDRTYLDELKASGIGDLSTENVISLKSLRVDANYIHDLDSVGFSHLTAGDYEELKSMRIDGAYVKYLRAHGFKNLTIEQVVELKSERI